MASNSKDGQSSHTFQLLHLSDLHFGAWTRRSWVDAGFSGLLKGKNSLVYPTSHSPVLAEAVAEVAFSLRGSLDAVLITGDLASTGSDEDLREAHAFVTSPPTSLWLADANSPTLAASDAAMIVLPGNHDRFKGPEVRPPCWSSGGRAFDRYFSEWSTRRAVAYVLQGQASQTEHLGIVCGDFSLRRNSHATGRRARLGQGYAYRYVLNRMVKLTQEVRSRYERSAVIWAVHFPPLFPHNDSLLELLEGTRVLVEAAQRSIQYILCGHTHDAMVYKYPRFPRTEVHCGGSACILESNTGNSFQVREVDVRDGSITSIRHHDYFWQDKMDRFELFS